MSEVGLIANLFPEFTPATEDELFAEYTATRARVEPPHPVRPARAPRRRTPRARPAAVRSRRA